MKREVETTRTEKHTTVIYTCDVCGEEFTRNPYCSGVQCSICERDVCNACKIYSDSIFEEYIDSDYPDRYCYDCWENEERRDELLDANAEYEIKKREIFAKWKEDTLRTNVAHR